MGYSETILALDSLKKGLLEMLNTYFKKTNSVTGTTYGTILQWTVDVSDLQYIYFNCTIETDGNNGSVKILAGSTLIYELANQVDGTEVDTKLDFTGVSGEQAIKIQLKNSNAANLTFLANLTMYGTEA